MGEEKKLGWQIVLLAEMPEIPKKMDEFVLDWMIVCRNSLSSKPR